MTIRIALVGDFNPAVTAHQAIPKAIEIAAGEIGISAEYDWIATPRFDDGAAPILSGYDGMWCVPASPRFLAHAAVISMRFWNMHAMFWDMPMLRMPKLIRMRNCR